MARPITYAFSRLGRVARHFGLTMAEVATLLGISPALATRSAAGSRALTQVLGTRLQPFEAALDSTTWAEVELRGTRT